MSGLPEIPRPRHCVFHVKHIRPSRITGLYARHCECTYNERRRGSREPFRAPAGNGTVPHGARPETPKGHIDLEREEGPHSMSGALQ